MYNSLCCPCVAAGFSITVSGQIRGANSLGVPNAQVDVGSTGGGTPYATFTCDSAGNYSGTVPIPTSSATVRFTGSGGSNTYAARFSNAIQNVSVVNGNSYTQNLNLLAATGYQVNTGSGLYFPLRTTLFLTDTLNGSFTLTATGASTWQKTGTVNYTACGACAGQTAVPYVYTYTGNQIRFTYGSTTVGGCPNPAQPNTTQITKTVTAADPFAISTSVPTGNTWYCSGSYTWSMSE